MEALKRAHEVTLDDNDLAWLRSTYPGVSLSKFFSMFLTEFRLAHSVTPADLAKRSAQEVRVMLQTRNE